jgi:hypothetical protein
LIQSTPPTVNLNLFSLKMAPFGNFSCCDFD